MNDCIEQRNTKPIPTLALPPRKTFNSYGKDPEIRYYGAKQLSENFLDQYDRARYQEIDHRLREEGTTGDRTYLTEKPMTVQP